VRGTYHAVEALPQGHRSDCSGPVTEEYLGCKKYTIGFCHQSRDAGRQVQAPTPARREGGQDDVATPAAGVDAEGQGAGGVPEQGCLAGGRRRQAWAKRWVGIMQGSPGWL
jgi:hypothetical protein